MLSLSMYLITLSDDYDQDKLTILYNQFVKYMLSTAKKYVGIYQAEEDVVHNAILKIIDNLDHIDLQNTTKTRNYVCIITKSCAIDWLRNHKHDNEMEDIDSLTYDLEPEAPSPLELILSKDGYERVVNSIRSMDDKYRMVCELKFIHNMKENEIAELLGITQKTVSVRVYRSRKMLQKMLKEEYKVD